jgi:KDO2-lipid IV(A) lauroyltransferase
MVARLGYSPSVVATGFKNDYITNFYYTRRMQQGLEVIYLEDAVRKTLRKMKKNGIVCIVGDRDYTKDGVAVEFFGKITKFPAGAILMALRTGAALIPAFAIRAGICKYNVFFGDEIKLESKGYRVEEMKEDLMKWVRVMESYVRQYPAQWYRFEPFWEPEKE